MPYATVSPDLVQNLISQYPATRDDLSAIRDPRQPARYQGVYAHRHGGVNRGNNRYVINAYRARVFKFWELGSSFQSAVDAAKAVVSFYKCYFGSLWQKAFLYRKVTPWRLRVYGKRYAVEIFVRGRPVGITHADTGEGSSDVWTWATPRRAKAAARLAMQLRFEKERALLPIPEMRMLFWRA